MDERKEKILGVVELLGLSLVTVAACVWIVPSVRELACMGMAVATVLLAVGRFLQTPFYLKYSNLPQKELVLKRLYHQRVFGMVALILAVTLMWLPTGFYYGVFVGPSSWLLLFVFFVVVEVYTAFRISAAEKG